MLMRKSNKKVYATGLQSGSFVFCNNPNAMYNTRDITENGQKDIKPEMFTYSNLQEYAQRGQDNCNDDFNEFHNLLFYFRDLLLLH